MKKSIFLLPLFYCLIFLFSCDKDQSAVDACDGDFDQRAMFENIADNLIIPQYVELTDLVNKLSDATNDFADNPNSNTLANVKTAMVESWKNWQLVAQYSFGPAEDVFLRNSVNSFPLNFEEMIPKIESGNTDFSSPDDFDKGFPALDYLLFGVANNNENVIYFYKNTENANYNKYLKAVAEDIKTRIGSTLLAWQSDYANQFKNNTGTAAGTSLSQIINGLNQNYELIKREKIGVPSGVLTLGFPRPESVEAPYSGISTELAKIALGASQQLYFGNQPSGTTGVGLDDFLVETSNQDLDQAIKNQFQIAIASLDEINENLGLQLEENKEKVVDTYTEISKNLVNLKTDMPSVLCVSITYIDNPSDSD